MKKKKGPLLFFDISIFTVALRHSIIYNYLNMKQIFFLLIFGYDVEIDIYIYVDIDIIAS